MAGKIKREFNTEAYDTEVDAQIVVPWILNPNTGEYEVSTKGDGGFGGDSIHIKRDSDNTLINPAREEDITALRLSNEADSDLAHAELVDVNLALDELVTLTDTLEFLLNNIDLKVSTEATLELCRTLLNSIHGVLQSSDTLLESIDLKVATETTLALLNGKVATETKLEAVRSLIESIRDTHFRRTDPLAAGTNQIGAVVPNRPSQGVGRVYTDFNVDLISASQSVYTVTAGKKLYITSWGGTIVNTSSIVGGHVRLRDGGVAGPIVASWNLPTAVAGAAAPTVRLSATFPEPKQINTSLFLQMVTGTLSTCFQGTGYEE